MSTGLRRDQVRGLGPPRREDEIYADEFGLRPNSTADQTDRLERALTAAAEEGKTLVVPFDAWVLNVSVPANTRMRCLHRATLHRISSASSSVVLNLVGNDIELDRVWVDGNGSGLGLANSGAIETSAGVSQITIHRCRVHNTYSHGIRPINTEGGVYVTYNKLTDVGVTDPVHGIVMGGSGGSLADIYDAEIVGNRIGRHTSNTAGYGMIVRGSVDGTTRVLHHVRVHNNFVDHRNGGGGLAIEVWSEHATITGNTILGNTSSLGGFGISNGVRNHATITGNTIFGKTIGIEAIAAAGAQYVSCTANVVEGCPTGIVAWSSDARATVSDNIIVGSTSNPLRIAGEWGIAEGNIIDCPDASNGINTTQSIQRGSIAENIIEVDPTGIAIRWDLNVNGLASHMSITGNEVVAASVGVQMGGTGDATSSFNGTIVGNDLSGATTAISKTGSTVLGDIRIAENAGDDRPHRAKVERNSNQLSSTGVPITVLFTSVVYDYGDMVDLAADASEVVIQEDGLYVCDGHASWASNATGRRILGIQHTTAGPTVTTHGETTQNADAVGSHNQVTGSVSLECVAGDVIELLATYAGAGTPATLNITHGVLSVRRVA